MAFSKNLAKEWYKNYSVEELEKMWNDYIVKQTNKEVFVKTFVDEFLNASYYRNTSSSISAVLELLKEKTGKDYFIDSSKTYEIDISYKMRKDYAEQRGEAFTIKEKDYLITFNDIFEYIFKDNQDPFWKETFKNFYNNLDFVTENDKLKMLLALYYDKEDNNNLSKVLVSKDYDIKLLYLEYKKITDEFYLKNQRIG